MRLAVNNFRLVGLVLMPTGRKSANQNVVSGGPVGALVGGIDFEREQGARALETVAVVRSLGRPELAKCRTIYPLPRQLGLGPALRVLDRVLLGRVLVHRRRADRRHHLALFHHRRARRTRRRHRPSRLPPPQTHVNFSFATDSG